MRKFLLVVPLCILFAMAAFAAAPVEQVAMPSASSMNQLLPGQQAPQPRTMGELDDIIWTEDFEGDLDWEFVDADAQELFWQTSDWEALDGLNWRCFNPDFGNNGGYDNHWLQWLNTPVMDFTAVDGAVMSFDFRLICEDPAGATDPYDGWDGANVWGSMDGGETWTVLEPFEGAPYDATSLYSFGDEWGLGPGIGGWGGAHLDWSNVSFDLSEFAGVETVQFRLAFCSDPSYSTVDGDPDMTGFQVDNIVITDWNDVTVYADDADGNNVGGDLVPTAGLDTNVPPQWQIVELEDAPSPTHVLGIEDMALDFLHYYVYLGTIDLTDVTDGVTSLDVMLRGAWDHPGVFPNNPHWTVKVRVIGNDAWYYASNPWADPDGSNFVYTDAPDDWAWFNDTYGTPWDLTPYHGEMLQIRVEMEVPATEFNEGDTYIYFDDFTVENSFFEHDIIVHNPYIPFPNTLNYLVPATGTFENGGTMAEDFLAAFHAPGPFPIIPNIVLEPGEFDTRFLDNNADDGLDGWVPTMDGLTEVYTRAIVPEDQNIENNESEHVMVDVQPEGLYELGYDDRSPSYFTSRFVVGEGPATHFFIPEDIAPYDLNTIKVIWYHDFSALYNEVDFNYHILAGGETPGEEIYAGVGTVDLDHVFPDWLEIDVSNVDELAGLTGDFWVWFELTDEMGFPHIILDDPNYDDGNHFEYDGVTVTPAGGDWSIRVFNGIMEQPLPVPTNLTAQLMGGGEVLLNWIEPPMAGHEQELIYDDGEVDGGFYFNDQAPVGATFGNRFTPAWSCQLLEVSAYLYSTDAIPMNDVTFMVWDQGETVNAPGEMVFESEPVNLGAEDGWLVYDAEGEGLMFDGDFWVTVGFAVPGGPVVARDADGNPFDYRSFYSFPEYGDWTPLNVETVGIDLDLMVRATVLLDDEVVVLGYQGDMPADGNVQLTRIDKDSPLQSIGGYGITQPYPQTRHNGELDDFIEYNVYRNDEVVGSTADNTYTDMLEANGEYTYYVTGVWDEGESDPSNEAMVNYFNPEADILVFNADPVPGSADAIVPILEDMGYSVLVVDNLDWLTDDMWYDYVFAFTGMYPSNYTIETGSFEEAFAIDYLEAGGNLYLEGGDNFGWNPPENLIPYFNIVGIDDGGNDLEMVNGEDGTFTEGMEFEYGGANSWVDHLEAGEGATRVLYNPADGAGCGVVYDAGNYKTAAFSFQVGTLIDGEEPSTLNNLVTGLMDWFNAAGEPGTLTVPLAANYFELVSSNVVPDNMDAISVFGAIDGLRIVYQSDGGLFLPPGLNTIGDITITQGYRIFTDNASEWTVEGMMLDPTTEYNIVAGPWNWIGYPLVDDVNIEIAMGEIAPQITIVQADDGGMWIPSIPINTLGNMMAGTGYMAIATEDVTFQYASPVLASASTPDVWEIPEVEGAPAATGLPYAVLVRLSDDLAAHNPSTIDIYDGDLLVGKAAVLTDRELTPVTAWGGSDAQNVEGFVSGHPMTVKVTGADGSLIAVTTTGAFGEGAFADITIDGTDSALPAEFVVDSAYPNPFNPSVTVPFALPRAGEVSFTVYNVMGQQIASSTMNYNAGHHRFVFDGVSGNLVSGVYFLQVQFNGQVSTQKVMLLK